VIANTAQAASGSGRFTGTHPVGSQVRVKGLNDPGVPAFIELRDIPPAEVLVLIKNS
jgi:hypothetical protein